MSETTARLELPLLAPGQAQKELWHNEALARIDVAVQASVVAAGLAMPPPAPVAGQCWIVGPNPTGDWAGRAGALAGWTAGGWRIVAPRPGMAIWDEAGARMLRYRDGAWVGGDAVADPAGGATVDAEARATLSALLAMLRRSGVIAA